MAEQENIQTAGGVFPLLMQGKIDELLNLFTPDGSWTEPGPQGVLPSAGAFRGHEGLKKLFGRMANEGTEPVGGFTPPAIVAQGDKVAMFGHRGAKVKATGKTWEDDWVLLFTFQGSKIQSIQAYNDTAARVAAFSKA